LHRQTTSAEDTPVDIPETRYAKTDDGIHIAYQALGVGRHDILFVPGHISHLDLRWDEAMDAAWLRSLAQLARVIVMDRRGVGLSDRLSPQDLPPAEVLAEDIGVVLDAAGATMPVLLGWAEGGQIASLFAAMHPERVRGLILYGMWTHVAGEDRRSWEEYVEWAPPRWGSVELVMRDAREVFPSRADDAPFLRHIGRVQRSAASPGALRPLFELSMSMDVRSVLPTIAVPTLVLHRKRDSMQLVELMRDAGNLIPDAQLVSLPGIDHWISAEPQEPMFDAIETFLDGLAGVPHRPTRRLATVLFTDIVGSTERSAEVGDVVWKQMLEAHHRIIRTAIERHGGREISTSGDGFFATFYGPAAAARCAIDACHEVRSVGLEIRAGVHTGEVETIDAEVGGIGVTIGARVSALAGPSQVLVSSTVKDLTAGSGLAFEDAGEHELKGVPDRWRLYRVVNA
jgi:class 3 adenylate cyclase/pimeloyl-ACP methyl ester carboxylesterase